MPRQGEGWIFLDWKAPTDGGKVAAYKIRRRQRPSGPWTDAGMAIENEIALSNQERGEELEYRVIAVNKTGEGEASNIVMAVLQIEEIVKCVIQKPCDHCYAVNAIGRTRNDSLRKQ